MKKTAVCIKCGTFKKSALVKCKNCGFEPDNDYAAARSLILSETHILNEIPIGRPAEKLLEISQSIISGRPYPIDGEEQKQVVREYYKYMKSHPPPKWPLSRKLKWISSIGLTVLLVSVTGYLLLKYL